MSVGRWVSDCVGVADMRDLLCVFGFGLLAPCRLRSWGFYLVAFSISVALSKRLDGLGLSRERLDCGQWLASESAPGKSKAQERKLLSWFSVCLFFVHCFRTPGFSWRENQGRQGLRRWTSKALFEVG